MPWSDEYNRQKFIYLFYVEFNDYELAYFRVSKGNMLFLMFSAASNHHIPFFPSYFFFLNLVCLCNVLI